MEGVDVGRFLTIIAISLGGAVGWALGKQMSMAAAYCLAVLGAAAGSWLSRRYIRDHLP